MQVEPKWDGTALYLYDKGAALKIYGWGHQLRVEKLKDGKIIACNLGPAESISIKSRVNSHTAHKAWAATIPPKVKILCRAFPGNEFWLARAFALYPSFFDRFDRSPMLCTLVLESSWGRNGDIGILELKMISQATDQDLLLTLDVIDKYDAMTVIKNIRSNVVRLIQPEFLIRCLQSSEITKYLSTVRTYRAWHFQLIAEFPWAINTPLSQLLERENQEDIPLTRVLCINITGGEEFQTRRRFYRTLKQLNNEDSAKAIKIRDRKVLADFIDGFQSSRGL